MKAHLEIMAQKNANCNFVPTLAQDILRSQHVPMLALATSQYKITKKENIAV